MRLVALDAASGQPVAGAHIRLSKENWQTRKDQVIKIVTTDRNGEAIYTGKEEPYSMMVYTENDRFRPKIAVNGNISFPDEADNAELNINVFADRSLYRPGQIVKTSVVAYTARHRNDEVKVAAGKTIKLTLRDANYKMQAEKTVTTDDYGTASADFALPRTGLTGYFSVEATDREAATSAWKNTSGRLSTSPSPPTSRHIAAETPSKWKALPDAMRAFPSPAHA